MGVAAVAAVVTAVIAGASAYEQRQEQKAASKDRKEANEVARAEQAAQQTAQTRQQIREERIRRAQIAQSSENTGVAGSSGELGSIGALQTNIGSNIAAASRQANSATAITNLNQSAADHISAGQQAAAIGKVATSAVSLGVQGSSLFSPAQPTPTTGQQSPAEVSNPYNDNLNNLFGPRP